MNISSISRSPRFLRGFIGGAWVFLATCLVGCSQCPLEVVSTLLVRVLDREGRVTSAAVVTANGSNCPLDRDLTSSVPRYKCTVGSSSGADELEIQAVLEGRKATTVIASFGDSCAGSSFPSITLDLTP